MADTLLACDMLVAGHDQIIPALDPTRTRGIVNTERNFTGDFARDGDIEFPVDTLQSRLQQSMHAEESNFFEASEINRSCWVMRWAPICCSPALPGRRLGAYQ